MPQYVLIYNHFNRADDWISTHVENLSATTDQEALSVADSRIEELKRTKGDDNIISTGAFRKIEPSSQHS